MVCFNPSIFWLLQLNFYLASTVVVRLFRPTIFRWTTAYTNHTCNRQWPYEQRLHPTAKQESLLQMSDLKKSSTRSPVLTAYQAATRTTWPETARLATQSEAVEALALEAATAMAVVVVNASSVAGVDI